MAVKIRLKRIGAKKKPYYRIVVADARFPRDGRFIEQIGIYDPMTNPAKIVVDGVKALQWMKRGAQPTDTVRALLKSSGAMDKARDDEATKDAFANDAPVVMDDFIPVDEPSVGAISEAATLTDEMPEDEPAAAETHEGAAPEGAAVADDTPEDEAPESEAPEGEAAADDTPADETPGGEPTAGETIADESLAGETNEI